MNTPEITVTAGRDLIFEALLQNGFSQYSSKASEIVSLIVLTPSIKVFAVVVAVGALPRRRKAPETLEVLAY